MSLNKIIYDGTCSGIVYDVRFKNMTICDDLTLENGVGSSMHIFTGQARTTTNVDIPLQQITMDLKSGVSITVDLVGFSHNTGNERVYGGKFTASILRQTNGTYVYLTPLHKVYAIGVGTGAVVGGPVLNLSDSAGILTVDISSPQLPEIVEWRSTTYVSSVLSL